jgi:hypothetical protein
MPRIVSDIDGTVLQDGQPVQAVIDYIKGNFDGAVFLTARPESDRGRTEADLGRVGIAYERLVMAPDDLALSVSEFKAGEVKAMLEGDVIVDEFIDDNADNRSAVESLGVKVTDPVQIGEIGQESSSASSLAFSAPLIFRNMEPNLANLLQTPEQIASDLASKASALSAESAAKDAELTAVRQSLAEATIAHEAALASLTAELTAAKAQLADALSKAASLEEAKVDASDEAAKLAAQMGIAPLAATPAAEPEAIKPENILAKYEALSGDERQAFYRANKRAIFAARNKAE